jgi:nicotinamidase-related amidase
MRRLWQWIRGAVSLRHGRHSNSIDVMRVVALNGGQYAVSGGSVTVITAPGSGAYSAFIPLAPSERGDGPAALRCQFDLHDGLIGLCAVTPDYKIIVERVASRFGRQNLDILVRDLRNVAGILVRNSAVTGTPSRGSVLSVTVERDAKELLSGRTLLPIGCDRPSYTLRLPVRECYRLSHGVRQHQVTDRTIETAKLAVVIIDAWDGPDDERVLNNVVEKLGPALELLRSIGGFIIHAPHDHPVHPSAQPVAGEAVLPGDLSDNALISESLRAAGIEYLIYLGYMSNMCMMNRPIGFLEMRSAGFNTIFLRDASVAYETEESIAGEWHHKAMMHFVEINGGATTSLADLRSAVEQAQKARAIATPGRAAS